MHLALWDFLKQKGKAGRNLLIFHTSAPDNLVIFHTLASDNLLIYLHQTNEVQLKSTFSEHSFLQHRGPNRSSVCSAVNSTHYIQAKPASYEIHCLIL